MKKNLLKGLGAFAVSLLLVGDSFGQMKIGERFTPQNSAILLVDHQNMTMDWIKSIPKKPLSKTSGC